MTKGRTAAPQLPVLATNSIPDCPDHLDKIAKAKWKWLVEILSDLGTLHLADRDILEFYCAEYSVYRQALIHVAKEGENIIAANGYQQRNKWAESRENALRNLRFMQNSLGLNPAAREKLTIKQGGDASKKWDGLVK